MCWFHAIKLCDWKKCVYVFICFSKVVLVSGYQTQKKKYIWNAKYTTQHRIERSQTIKCTQYNIHDTMSCELPNCWCSCPTYVCKKLKMFGLRGLWVRYLICTIHVYTYVKLCGVEFNNNIRVVKYEWMWWVLQILNKSRDVPWY